MSSQIKALSNFTYQPSSTICQLAFTSNNSSFLLTNVSDVSDIYLTTIQVSAISPSLGPLNRTTAQLILQAAQTHVTLTLMPLIYRTTDTSVSKVVLE